MNMSPVLSARFAQVVTLAGLIGLMAGCNMVSMTQPLHEETRTSNIPHLEEEALDVVTRNGSVTVRREDRDDVPIAANAVQGEIDVSTSNGRIKITDAIGRVDAKTSNGSIRVRGRNS